MIPLSYLMVPITPTTSLLYILFYRMSIINYKKNTLTFTYRGSTFHPVKRTGKKIEKKVDKRN